MTDQIRSHSPELPSGRTGVLLFNLGGPETLDDVYPFLLNLFCDPEIFRVPRFFQPLIARIIARRRVTQSREYYSRIGGGSPLRRITEEQARLLEEELNRNEAESRYTVRVAMRYAPPRADTAIRELLETSPDQILFLPLYPHRSRTTTGSSFREAKILLGRIRPEIPVLGIPAYPVYVPFIEALVDTIGESIREVPDGEPVHLIFSAHGIPEFLVKKDRDPYQSDTESTVNASMERIQRLFPDRKISHTLAYQSRVGPLKWLGPETRGELVRLANAGTRNVLMVPVSFVSDHQETLYEMDILYRELARDLNIHRFIRVPSLNARPLFIRALASMVREKSGLLPGKSGPCPCNCGVCPVSSPIG
ncbi:MAG: ferrochelatase [Leptospirales bacterium]